MPTRSVLLALFVLLVLVPVGAAVYFGAIGLERERAMLVGAERDAMERRADEVRDALVRELQELYRRERDRDFRDWDRYSELASNDRRRPAHDYFQVLDDGSVRLPWGPPQEAPPDVQALAGSVVVRQELEADRPFDAAQTRNVPKSEAKTFVERAKRAGENLTAQEAARNAALQGEAAVLTGDLRFHGELVTRPLLLDDGTRLVQGFRIDPERVARTFLDPAAPRAVVPRFDQRIDGVALVRDDKRLGPARRGPHGLPAVLYRWVLPSGRDADPVLLPPGYRLAFRVRPAAALATRLDAASTGVGWTLGGIGVVVLLGLLFAWRAVSAEARLTDRKAEFISAVSHELRTPLTSIRMYADLLKEGWVRDEATARDYFALISAESERLARLVNNVLDFSHIAKQNKTFDLRVGDPAPVVRDVVEVLRPYLKEKGFALALEVPETLPACAFDKDALTQILVNLIDNAVKHGENEVRIEAEVVDGEIVVRVLDRGPGVPAAERRRIFEAFERGGGAKSGRGSGLGLALVDHYVKAHRGRIEVGDRDGGGAVFAITLPAA